MRYIRKFFFEFIYKFGFSYIFVFKVFFCENKLIRNFMRIFFLLFLRNPSTLTFQTPLRFFLNLIHITFRNPPILRINSPKRNQFPNTFLLLKLLRKKQSSLFFQIHFINISPKLHQNPTNPTSPIPRSIKQSSLINLIPMIRISPIFQHLSNTLLMPFSRSVKQRRLLEMICFV